MKGIHPVLSQSAMILTAAVLTVGLASGIATGLRFIGATGPGELGTSELQFKITTGSSRSPASSAKSSSRGNNDNQTIRIEEEEEDDEKECILFVNPCPLTNPQCGMDVILMDIACSDARCTTNSCLSKEELKKISSSSRQSSVPNTNPNACVLQTFECAPGALASCYKRVRSAQLDCTDRRCTTSTCIPASVFFARQTLEPWDMGALEGPFPRKETMCVVQRTACPPNDPSCLSPVSLEQIECKNCSGDTCTHIDILVDERDNILGNVSTTLTEDEETRESGESETTRSSATSQATARTTVQETAQLGCFTDRGIWTTDRSACAADQNQFLQQNVTVPTIIVTPPDEEIKREIDRQLVPDTTRSALIQSLLSSIFDASQRLNSMLFLPIPDQLRASVIDTAEWLKVVQRDAQQPERTISDLQQIAGSVYTKLSEIQNAVSDWSRDRPEPVRNPTSLTGKIDSVFGKIAAAFGIVQQELIPLPSSVLSDFTRAQSIYEGLKPACIANTDLCGELSSVVDLLESAVAGLQLTLEEAGRQDLIDRIDAML